MTSTNFLIDGKRVGEGEKTLIIAEVAQAHDGSLGTAYAYVDAAAEVGVDIIKFQTHIAEAESTFDDQFRIKFSKQDATRFDYWKRMEFTPAQWQDLANYSRDKGLIFLSSGFSLEAIDLLDNLGMQAWKIASGEIISDAIIDRVVKTKRPLLVSTGMSNYEEIDQIASKLVGLDVEFALMQCTSKYPTPLEEVGINVLHEYKRKYNCCVGLSDHSGSIYPAMASIAQGANLIELHVTFSKQLFGPDVIASVTFEELKMLIDFRDTFYLLDSNPVDKNNAAKKMQSMRKLFLKSVALKEDSKAGTKLEENMLTTKKPGSGIPMEDIQRVIGKTLKNDVSKNNLLDWNDLDE